MSQSIIRLRFPFTNVFNVTGQLAISLPIAWSKHNLLIGMQFVAKFNDEATLLQLAFQLEKVKPWITKLPNIHASKIDY